MARNLLLYGIFYINNIQLTVATLGPFENIRLGGEKILFRNFVYVY